MGSVVSFINHTSDMNSVQHHVEDGGCIDEFMGAIAECHPDAIKLRDDPGKRVLDAEACARATAALRRCFGGNRLWFEHQYIARLDHGLDEHVKPSPKQVKKEDDWRWRWWTGMRTT